MRVRRFDLTRYGIFTNRALDFGSRGPDEPDIHIIYGDNEAGKSTTLSAWQDFLYGVRIRTQYGFLHDNAIEIGALLENSEKSVELCRVKTKTNSLLGLDRKPVEEIVLANFLGGIDRDQYGYVFSVNDDTLEKGGNEILNSKGDLGRLLFSASAGLSELSSQLGDLQTKCDNFYRPRAHKTQLNLTKTELNNLKDEWLKADIQAKEFAKLTEAYETARKMLETTRFQWSQSKKSLKSVDKKLTAMRFVDKLNQIKFQLKSNTDLPEPPADWQKRCDQLSTSQTVFSTQKKQLIQRINEIKSDLQSESIDSIALDLSTEVGRIGNLQSSYNTAIRDLPKRKIELQKIKSDCQQLLIHVGLPSQEMTSLMPAAGILGQLRELIESFSGIYAKLQAAKSEYESVLSQNDHLSQRLEAEVAISDDAETVAKVLQGFRDKDQRLLLSSLDEQIKDLQEQFQQRMQQLQPWVGTGQQLASLRVPDRQIVKQWLEKCAKSELTLQNYGKDIDKLQDRIRQLEVDPKQSRYGKYVTTEDTAHTRGKRENLWVQHLDELSMTSAKTFESAMRNHDEVITRYMESRSEALKSDQQTSKLTEVRHELNGLVGKKDACLISHKAVRNEIEQSINHIFSEPGNNFALQRLPDWLEKRERLIEIWLKLNSKNNSKTAIQNSIESIRNELSGALARCGTQRHPESSIDTMIFVAEDLVKKYQALSASRDKQNELKIELMRRKNVFEKAKNAKKQWDEQWQSICSSTKFSPDPPPRVSAMREILETVEKYDRKFENWKSLKYRIEGIKRDRDTFLSKLFEFAKKLSIHETAPDQTWQKISSRVEKAKQRHLEERSLKANLNINEKNLIDIELQIEQLDQEIAQIGKPYGVYELPKLRDILRKAEFVHDLKKKQNEVILNIRDILQTDDALSVIKDLESIGLEQLEQEKERLETEDKELTYNFDECMKLKNRAQLELEGVSGTDDVARLKERYENLLLSLREDTVDHLKQKLGIIAVEHAIRNFMEIHRSDMMERASQIFKKISNNAYNELSTAIVKDSEILVAQASDGRTKSVDALSKGTRFQLYLALRIAGIYETAKSTTIVPFIADDVLETFDNNRTREALKVLENLSRTCQVIYFTHHRHLCDIAKDCCPHVAIQELQTI